MIGTIWTQGRWKRAVGTAMATLLLFAVPASALTFVPGWIVIQSQQHGAPAATVMPDFPGAGLLFVNMHASATGGAKSTVTAVKTFTIEGAGETFSIRHNFRTFLDDASLKVTMKIGNKNGFKIPDAKSAKVPVQTVKFDETFAGFLTPGTYNLTVKIIYKNKKTGGPWNNSPVGSPHTLQLRTL